MESSPITSLSSSLGSRFIREDISFCSSSTLRKSLSRISIHSSYSMLGRPFRLGRDASPLSSGVPAEPKRNSRSNGFPAHSAICTNLVKSKHMYKETIHVEMVQVFSILILGTRNFKLQK
uniref:Uncharacterized protein n=1 Tax=Capsicum annuum TaxID=4072 RepID=A0A075VW06_CAPAN|nr:hypothetical protein [Capsicum annuum]